MAKSANQKQKLLRIMEYLLENTDEDHVVSTQQIIAYLESYEIGAERKSIYDDIATLQDFGLDVIRKDGPKGGYYIASRDFELAEVKLLVDLVQSSKFITPKKSGELIKKLEGQVSHHQALSIHHQVTVTDRNKTANENIYYVVDLIHQGIAGNYQIRFRYFDWTVDKTKKLRKNGSFYQVSPWLLTWDDENYYLVAYSAADKGIRYYRVDKMVEAELTQIPREGKEDFLAKDLAAYTRRTFSMFAGDEEIVLIECKVDDRTADTMASVMIDRFGQDLPIRRDGDKLKLRANVEVSPQFFAWLTGLGDRVTLTGPASVVEEYQSYLKRILENYKG